jgi:hypothetical protein
VSKAVTVLPCSSPVISLLKIHRCDEDGTENGTGDYLKITFNASVSSLNGKNSATYQLDYAKTTGLDAHDIPLTDYEGQLSVTGGTYIFAADPDSAYSVTLTVTDDFESTPRTTGGSTAFTLMNFHSSGKGIAFGGVATNPDAAEFIMPAIFTGGVDIQPKFVWNDAAWHMVANQEVTFSVPVSQLSLGLILIFSYYNEENKSAEDYNWHSFFVPKFFVNTYTSGEIAGAGMCFDMKTSNFSAVCRKYMYFYDDKVKGNDFNNQSGTGASGITYNNAKFVLRYVVGI